MLRLALGLVGDVLGQPFEVIGIRLDPFHGISEAISAVDWAIR
ncbi:MAG: hypothetical protein ACKV2O_13445 [Acidimicrobiales bacterium]